MTYNFLLYLIPPLVAYLTHKLVINLAHRYSLLDIPDGELKPHSTPIPKLGGVGLFTGILSAVIIFPLPNWPIILIAIPIMFLLGLSDDIKPLSPKFRLVVQLGTGAFLGWQYHPSLFSLLIFAFAFTFFINAINMFDGINALLSTQTLLAWAGLFFLFESSRLILFSILALLPFYAFNRPQKATLFMGDAGSYTIAALGFIFIVFSESNLLHTSFSSTLNISLVLTLSCSFSIPILDALQVISRRVLERRSPFSGDRYHSYDLLSLKGWRLESILLTLIITQCLIFGIQTLYFYYKT